MRLQSSIASYSVSLLILLSIGSAFATDQKATQVRLDIFSEDACQLSIRGQPSGQVPARKERRIWVDAGEIGLACKSERGNEDIQTITASPGTTRRVRFVPDYVTRFTPEGRDFVFDEESGRVWSRRAGAAKKPSDAMELCRKSLYHGKEGSVPGIDALDLLADAPMNASTKCGRSVCRVSTLIELPKPRVFADQPTLRWFDLEQLTWGHLPETLDEPMAVLCVWHK